MLQNRIYRGEIVHKDQAYPGEHAAIIDEELWQKVQKTLAANRVDRGAGKGGARRGGGGGRQPRAGLGPHRR